MNQSINQLINRQVCLAGVHGVAAAAAHEARHGPRQHLVEQRLSLVDLGLHLVRDPPKTLALLVLLRACGPHPLTALDD